MSINKYYAYSLYMLSPIVYDSESVTYIPPLAVGELLMAESGGESGDPESDFASAESDPVRTTHPDTAFPPSNLLLKSSQ